jgi:hypothetical protein
VGGVAAAGNTASPVERCVVADAKMARPCRTPGGLPLETTARRLRPSGRKLPGHRRHPGLHEGRVRSRGRSESEPRLVVDGGAPLQVAVVAIDDKRMSRWPPSRPPAPQRAMLSRKPSAGAAAPFGAQPGLVRAGGRVARSWRFGVGKRCGVKSVHSVRGVVVRGVPVVGWFARIDERRLVAKASLGCG